MKYILHLIGLATMIALLFLPAYADAGVYGAGTYGSCQYSSCAITITSGDTVAAGVTPVATANTCTVRNDDVAVTTGWSAGYTLKINSTDSSNTLDGPGSNVINAVAASASSPAVLSNNTWGYRVDDIAGFGSGPTSTVTNGVTPTESFASVPTSVQTPNVIASSSVAVPTPATTTVWYGVCADVSLPTGTYSDGVTYTAIVN